MSKINKFDILYERIQKITELHSKIPPELWSDVFKTLYDVALEENEVSGAEMEIQSKSMAKNFKLSDFVDVNSLRSYVDKSLYFVYFLDLLEIPKITGEHVLACYSMLGESIQPNKLNQNLRDLASSKYNYLKFDGTTISITNDGRIACAKRNFVSPDAVEA